jgi:hypothetical protein
MHKLSSHAKRLGQSQGGDRTAVHGRASTFERCSKYFENAICLRCLVSYASPFVPEPSMTNPRIRIRSYRMKLDEWRMWKNNSKTERRRTKTISRRRQPRAITVAQSLEEAALPPPLEISTTDYVVLYGVSIPSGPLDIAELLPLISCLWAEPWSGLELMLFKWRPDGSYFKAAMNYLRDTKVPFRINFQTLAGTSIFRYIEDNVASHEKYPLAKMCLVLDFERFQNTNHGFGRPFPEWMSLWREACAYQTWKGVKECLDKFYYSLYVGSYFTPTALNFLAEKLLEKNLRKLAQWRDRIGVISISEADQAKLCRQESMDILDNFKDDGVYIDPIWYKRFFQCHETNDIEHWAYESLQLNQLREYRQKFYQLKILHDSASSADGLVPNLLNAATGELSQKWWTCNISNYLQCSKKAKSSWIWFNAKTCHLPMKTLLNIPPHPSWSRVRAGCITN